MPTQHNDIELVAGDDWVIPATLLDANGNPLNLTSASFTWTLVDPTGETASDLVGASSITVLNAANGTLQIEVPREFTEPLLPGRYHDGLRVVMSNFQSTYWFGTILVDGDPFSLVPPPNVYGYLAAVCEAILTADATVV